MSGDTKSVSGAGGTMGSECGTVNDVCRDDLLKQPETDGQTNTHWGVQEIQNQKPCGIKSKSNENIRTNCESYKQAQPKLVHICIRTMQVGVVIPEQIPRL